MFDNLKRPGLAWFCIANVLLATFVFRGAIWGASLLAPIDVAPACFEHYRFVDPTNSGVLKANAQFDQVVYDLPLQHGIYQSYRQGVIPWWDPYGFAGRPLLADAHINGTDPIRLIAYALLPFELAYNWTLIAHFFAAGLAMWMLLSHWQFSRWTCLGLALAYEFAGSATFFFGFPWVLGSFLYYPILWMAWDGALQTRRPGWWVVASMALAGIFYSGNLQSHAYVVLMASAFAVGAAGWSWSEWRRTLVILAFTGVTGALLAAPVLLNQLEFFLNGVRGVKPAISPRVAFAGLASLTSIYPWMLGDFRTLDLRSAFFQPLGFGQNYGLGFHTYIGSAGLVLASLGAWNRRLHPERARVRRTALALIVLFLVVISSPLIAVFYTRCSGLFVLGAIVLAAAGLEWLTQSREKLRKAGWTIAIGAILIAIATNTGALLIYPRVVAKVRQMLDRRESANAPGAIFKMPPTYRAFQIDNLPSEISFQNPETAIAFLSLLGVAGFFLRPSWRLHPATVPALLALNLIPAVLFCARFVPREPVASWHRLRNGGPDQQTAMRALGESRLRLLETATAHNDFLFPDALQHLYRVQTVHGYSALVPSSIQTLSLAKDPQWRSKVADYVYTTNNLEAIEAIHPVRFQWETANERTLKVDQKSLNQVVVEMGSGAAASLLWTDTRFPGWSADIDHQPVPLHRAEPCFSRIDVPANARTLTLTYRPRYLYWGLALASLGALGLGVVMLTASRWSPRPDATEIRAESRSSYARRD